ncbi:MAG: hypothetical protein J4452_04035 [Candidatus Aenigmarchaeota archaeon]|nr:hypothetical protein [Candidatus Aenigmarchaeota archaeon]
MIGKTLGFAVVIGLFVTIGTVFLSLILPPKDATFGWPYGWIKTSSVHCTNISGNNSFTCGLPGYEIIYQNLLIDWGIFSFIFFLLLIVLYKTNVLK